MAKSHKIYGRWRVKLQPAGGRKSDGKFSSGFCSFFCFYFFLYFSCCNYFVSINFFPLPKVVWSVSLPFLMWEQTPQIFISHLGILSPLSLMEPGHLDEAGVDWAKGCLPSEQRGTIPIFSLSKAVDSASFLHSAPSTWASCEPFTWLVLLHYQIIVF